MNYTVTHANGDNLIVYANSLNDSTSITMIGQGYTDYGQIFWGNFVHILENFSSPHAPPRPITGQVWYDNYNKLVKVYNGTNWDSINGPPVDMSSYASINNSQMTGSLVLSVIPTKDNSAVTREYIESKKFSFKEETSNYVLFDNNYVIISLMIYPNNRVVNLPKVMADTNYSVLVTLHGEGGIHTNTHSKTTTGFTVASNSTTGTISCIVMGFAK